MIYDHPVLRRMGEFYLIVEFGDEASIELNFRVIALDDSLRRAPINGILETVVTTRSLALIVDPTVESRKHLEHELAARAAVIGTPDTIDSRTITIPACLDFAWADLGSAGEEFAGDREFVAAHNGLTGQALADRLTATPYWITGLGFLPGNGFSYPLIGERTRLSSPKLATPRRWIPERAVVIGGLNVAISPTETASGYRVIGRTPIDIYDPQRRNRVFGDGPTLFRRGDRLKWAVISMETYRELRSNVESGTYEYEVVAAQFDVRGYLGAVPEPAAGTPPP